MRLSHLFFAAALALNFSVGAQAEEHPLSTLKGTNIDLKVYDHAMAGSVKDFVMWGFVDEAKFQSELIMRKDGQTIKATFGKMESGKFGGQIVHQAAEKTIETNMVFEKVDKTANALLLNINGEPVEVKIAAEKFENNHFQNPTYTATYKGETVSYTLQGQACWSYSLHLAFVVLGAYVH